MKHDGGMGLKSRRIKYAGITVFSGENSLIWNRNGAIIAPRFCKTLSGAPEMRAWVMGCFTFQFANSDIDLREVR
jgi:hypothetical protein